MIPVFYGSIFVVSLIFTAIYVFIWHKHFDVNFTMIFTLVPVSCLGYLMNSTAKSMEGAIFSLEIEYIGGCFLQLFMLFSILNLCGIEVTRWLRLGLFFLNACLYGSVLTMGESDLFYKNLRFRMAGGVGILSREYGPMHTVFYAMIVLYFLAGLALIFYSLLRKMQVPRMIIKLLVMPDVICVFSFFVARKLLNGLDVVPLGYVLAEFIYLMIALRVNLYDVSDTVIDSMVQIESIAYISFDFRYRYLGSNESARLRFGRDPEHNSFVYTLPDPDGNEELERIYNVSVNYLYDGARRRGYIITMTDDTAKQKYIRLLDTYNDNLQEEVKEKTRHIIEMHDNLIMSLATMVESRDNSTGGHIRRTSEGVRILVEEIIKEGTLPLSEEFCKDVIKAAPMHDLGKIAVDDAVLRKPGRFTDEEYAKMKQHAAEGARVIHEILLHTDDNSFKQVAENVAHYHHERWDGSGYPEGLAGEQIPIEARIMAIADVYDALVSKRVYKEAFDFEKADRIIMEGMGTQFDPGLRTAYEQARSRLELYYMCV